MPIKLSNSAVVITAAQLNPSIFAPGWVKNRLGVSDDMLIQMVFTPTVANFTTTQFNLLVLPDRLQFALHPEVERPGELVKDKIGTIVELLPHTPYSAVGLNFDWDLRIEERPINEVTRKLFFSESNWLCREFAGEDACFGAYACRNVLGCRLKLDVKPITPRGVVDGVAKKGEDYVQLSFNFNLDLDGDERPSAIKTVVGRWDEAKAEATRIVELAQRELA